MKVLNYKKTNRCYTPEFRQEAVKLVKEQGYSVAKGSASLDITDKLLYKWKAKFEAEQFGVFHEFYTLKTGHS